MTRRERLERKIERRLEWADKANTKATADFNRASSLTENIPFGQPNVEGRLSSIFNRSYSAMNSSVANYNKAEYHTQKAEGLQRQLDNTIYSDDVDAVEQLENKIAELEAIQERYKEFNKFCRKLNADKEEDGKAIASKVKELVAMGYPSYIFGIKNGKASVEHYALTNNNANIRRYKKRLEEIQLRNKAMEEAAQTEHGISIKTVSGWHYITFAEKPDWETRQLLKDSGFRWTGTSWRSSQDVPEEIKALATVID